MDTFRTTVERAESLANQAATERRWREAGRRESDRELQALRDRLRLAGNLLAEAIGYVQGKDFSEQQLTALEIGLDVVRGNDG